MPKGRSGRQRRYARQGSCRLEHVNGFRLPVASTTSPAQPRSLRRCIEALEGRPVSGIKAIAEIFQQPGFLSRQGLAWKMAAPDPVDNLAVFLMRPTAKVVRKRCAAVAIRNEAVRKVGQSPFLGKAKPKLPILTNPKRRIVANRGSIGKDTPEDNARMDKRIPEW